LRGLIVYTFVGTIATWFMKWDITPHLLLLGTGGIILFVIGDE
jgi:hypothetical protein